MAAHLRQGALKAETMGPPPVKQPVDAKDASNDRRCVGEAPARTLPEGEEASPTLPPPPLPRARVVPVDVSMDDGGGVVMCS